MGLPLALLVLCGASRSVRAADAEADEGATPAFLETHGFVSQGAIKTTANNYLANSHRGSFEFSEVGINFTTQPVEKLRVGVQLFASKLGSNGNFSVKADWYYLDYRWKDWLGLRAGRVKLPLGLYNDTSDIDAARVPVLLPQSVYPIADRDFLLAQTGLELYGFVDLQRAGAIEYRLYGGTIFIPTSGQLPGPVQITAVDSKYVVGGRLMWDTALPGLRVGASMQKLDLVFQLQSAMTATAPAMTITAHIPAFIWIGSLEYAAHDLLLAAEYSRWYLRLADTNAPMFFPDTSTTSERLYGSAAYRVWRWLQPGVYYSLYRPDLDPNPVTNMNSGRAASQHDAAATLRFDINPHWLVKLEGHFMHGTAALEPGLNGGTPRSELTSNWAVFLVKTTAYF